MSKKVKIIGCVAVLAAGLTGSAQDLNENDVIRHYDVTGKACPVAFQKFTGYNGQRMEKLKEVF